MKNDLNFPHEKFQVILVDFIDFSLERIKAKVERTDALTEPLMSAQLKS